jgi:methionyl-tRNA formyltransferase
MKISVICSTDSLAIPVLSMLNERGILGDVFVLERLERLCKALITTGIPAASIRILPNDNWQQSLVSRIHQGRIEMIWVFGFPWIMPSSVIDAPLQGMFNFHYGRLPEYKGSDPVFWQMRNGLQHCHLTIHRITQELDAGPVAVEHEMPLLPGENYGLAIRRLGVLALRAAEEFLGQVLSGEVHLKDQPQEDSPWLKKPSEEDLTIRWTEQSAAEIEALVNASNPRYGGAITHFHNSPIRILEVTPADMQDAPAHKPGTIVYADHVYGLIVACRDNSFLRITVANMHEGVFSGIKLFAMGMKPGQQFITNQPSHSISQTS